MPRPGRPDASAAVDAFHRVDVEHLLGPELVESFLDECNLPTGIHTGGVFGSDAGLGNYVGHKISCSSGAGSVIGIVILARTW